MKALICAASLAAATLFSWGGQAQDRYVQPPPVMVSPDLSAPWVMQLRRMPQNRRTEYRQYQVDQYQQYQQSRNARVQRYRAPAARVQPQPRQMRTAAVAPRPSKRAWDGSDPKWLPQVVEYRASHAPGTVVIDTNQRFLYLVLKDGKARRYGVGVGKEGFEWTGTEKISRKREWPDWRPPAEMIAREKAKGRTLPVHMKGGPANPLGARALYLGNTLYRIHGTNAPWTIGRAVSSGCIRMRNEDVMDLYNRVPVGTKVVVI